MRDFLHFSTASENNQSPILERLTDYFERPGMVLEIGSGSGQHAVFFGERLPHLVWQPSDQGEYLEGLVHNIGRFAPENVRPPVELDVSVEPWPVHVTDYLFSANTLHIMSWQHVECFFRGAGKVVKTGGLVVLYGPFKYDGEFTTGSNARFDLWLKERDPVSGIRDFERIAELAENENMRLMADHPMPANNQLLVFRKD